VAFGADDVRTALRTSWQVQPGECVPLAERMWRVVVGPSVYLATHLPDGQRAQFEAGLRAAEQLEAAGIGAGEPVRAADGAFTVGVGGGVLALMRWVPGRPLRADDPIDQQWWGDSLATVHRVLRRYTHPALGKFYSVRPEARHLDVAAWLRPAVQAALTAVKKLCVTDQLTYGVLHGEPAADRFRLDPDTGRVGLVGWGRAGSGPLVYDMAAAVLFAGGPDTAGDLVDGYVSAGTVSREECDAALPTMLRYRSAVLADRLAAGGADQNALLAIRPLIE
jgi:homoserine kinase type II